MQPFSCDQNSVCSHSLNMWIVNTAVIRPYSLRARTLMPIHSNFLSIFPSPQGISALIKHPCRLLQHYSLLNANYCDWLLVLLNWTAVQHEQICAVIFFFFLRHQGVVTVTPDQLPSYFSFEQDDFSLLTSSSEMWLFGATIRWY